MFIPIFLIGTALLVRNIGQDWNNHWTATDGALFSSIAKNYLQHGVWDLHLAQVSNFYPTDSAEQFEYYQHHPPILPIAIAASFSVLGESEVAARIVPITATLGSLLLIFLLGRRLYGERQALIGAFIFATAPAIAFFGQKVGYEALTLFSLLLSMSLYLRLLEKGRATDLLWLFLAVALGLATDWGAYFIAPLLAVHYWFQGKQAPYRYTTAIGLMVLAPVFFALHLAISYLADPNSITDLIYKGMTHAGLIAPDSDLAKIYVAAKQKMPLGVYINYVMRSMNTLFTYPVLVLAGFGLWVLFADRRAGMKSPGLFVPVILLLTALANWLAFWTNAYRHLYWFYYFAAPFALMAAAGANQLLFARNAQQETSVKKKYLASAFLVALVLTGAVPEIRGLHLLQTHALPLGTFESATFLKTLGQQLHQKTGPTDLIAIDLAGGRGTTASIAYYAQRYIAFGVGDKEAIQRVATGTRIDDDRIAPNGKLYLLTLASKEPFAVPGSFELASPLIKFKVQGHRFVLAELKRDQVRSSVD